MQDRYVGDVGDFVKLSLLKSLSPEYRLGVVWYLVANEAHNGDGRHIDYLRDDGGWRHLNSEVFDSLKRIVNNGERSVAALERDCAMSDCRYMSDLLPLPEAYAERQKARAAWLQSAVKAVSDCNLVFLDPDNGIQPERFSATRNKSIKCVSFEDLKSFRKAGRALVVYHHQTHRRGGNLVEIGYNADRLRKNGFERVDALRASPYSPRAFFLLNTTEEIRTRAAEFARKWGTNRVTWHASPTLH